MSDCTCADWKPNLDLINGYITTAIARSGFRDQYSGKPFVYCPWCGRVLDAANQPYITARIYRGNEVIVDAVELIKYVGFKTRSSVPTEGSRDG